MDENAALLATVNFVRNLLENEGFQHLGEVFKELKIVTEERDALRTRLGQ